MTSPTCVEQKGDSASRTYRQTGMAVAGDRPVNSAELMPRDEEVGLSVLVPVYNERRTVRAVLEKLQAVGFPTIFEVVVVDDGSTDGTAQVLGEAQHSMGFRLFCHESNQGKGSAVRTALRHAQGRVVVVQDADQELDPHDLLPMFEALSRGEAAVCYGSRFAQGTGHLRWRATYWANRFLNAVCNLLNGLKLTDMNTCYKMMPADVLRRLDLVSRGFTLEPEITTKLARLGIGIIERPISYRPRNYSQGKKIQPSMFFHYIAALLRFRFFWRKDQAPHPWPSHLQEAVQREQHHAVRAVTSPHVIP